MNAKFKPIINYKLKFEFKVLFIKIGTNYNWYLETNYLILKNVELVL